MRESWAQVEPIADAAATLFYARLSTIDPALRARFPSLAESGAQADELMRDLTRIVQRLDRAEHLARASEALGGKLARWRLKARHRHAIREALLWTLQQGLGPRFTPAVRDAWEEAYDRVSALLLPLAYEDEPLPES